MIGMMKMGKTRYKTKFGNLNVSGIIERLKKEKSVKYSRKLNCHYAYIDAEYSNRKIHIFFSEMKGLLKLGKCQCRNFSSQIASVSLTMM